jgi:hypothetical protein
MNPKDFSWSEDQRVVVTNPTDKDYNFKVHNKDYTVKAGGSVKMPGFIAWKYVYDMAAQSAQDDGDFVNWGVEGVRKQHFEKFVTSIEDTVQQVEDVKPVELETVSTPKETKTEKDNTPKIPNKKTDTAAASK